MRILKNIACIGLLTLPLNGLMAGGVRLPLPPTAKIEKSQSVALKAIFDKFFQEALKLCPESGTILGVAGYDHLWSDLTRETFKRRYELASEILKELRTIDRSRLTEDERFQASVLEYQLENQLKGCRFKDELMPITQLNGPHLDVSQTVKIMPTTTRQEYDNILERYERVPQLLEQAIVLLQEGLRAGITPPQVTLEGVPDSIKVQLPEKIEESPFFAPFKQFPESFSAQECTQLRQEALESIATHIYPAMRKFHDYVVEKYLPHCRISTAMSDLPDGEAWYRYAVRTHTTTDLTPEAIHATGLDEVKRIQRAMRGILKEIGYSGSLEQFFHSMRTDPQFFFETPEELLAEYRRILKVVEGHLSTLFGKLPKMPYEVQPMPDFLAKTAPAAYYMMGSLSTGRPGIFYANTYDLKARPKWEMEDLALHEALPGHHFQIALALEKGEIPDFRKLTLFTAYVEGWALYAEGLGSDLGLYKDPYARFGGLSGELFRAVRLVVDTGLHSKGWSRQQAVDYFLANTDLAEHDINAEVNRYIVWPGQALAYKVGQMKIMELRRLAEKRLGSRFEIRAFHDALLAQGDMPLHLLDSYMKKWVRSR